MLKVIQQHRICTMGYKLLLLLNYTIIANYLIIKILLNLFLKVDNTNNTQRNSGQYYYNIPPLTRNNEANYLINSNHNHTQSNHSHSISHSHSHSNPPIAAHSHSNSAGQLTMSHRNSNVNGHNHTNNHVSPIHGNSSANSNHNRESSGLDLAGSREQRGSAFELYRKPPMHHHNVR